MAHMASLVDEVKRDDSNFKNVVILYPDITLDSDDILSGDSL